MWRSPPVFGADREGQQRIGYDAFPKPRMNERCLRIPTVAAVGFKTSFSPIRDVALRRPSAMLIGFVDLGAVGYRASRKIAAAAG